MAPRLNTKFLSGAQSRRRSQERPHLLRVVPTLDSLRLPSYPGLSHTRLSVWTCPPRALFVCLTKADVGTRSQREGVRGWGKGPDRKLRQGSSLDRTPAVRRWCLILPGLWGELTAHICPENETGHLLVYLHPSFPLPGQRAAPQVQTKLVCVEVTPMGVPHLGVRETPEQEVGGTGSKSDPPRRGKSCTEVAVSAVAGVRGGLRRCEGSKGVFRSRNYLPVPHMACSPVLSSRPLLLPPEHVTTFCQLVCL